MAFQTVPPVHHQLTLSGIVADAETSALLAGVTAAITSMPAAFQQILAGKAVQWGARWATMTERPDLTSTAADGSFGFVDLPDGAYVVTLSAPSSVGVYGSAQASFSVARDASGNVTATTQVVSLPPTGVRGLVNGTPPGAAAGTAPSPLPAARARVRGSGELTYTGGDGTFYLPNVSPGTITLELSAPNYDPVTTPVTIASGTITDVGTQTLTPTS